MHVPTSSAAISAAAKAALFAASESSAIASKSGKEDMEGSQAGEEDTAADADGEPDTFSLGGEDGSPGIPAESSDPTFDEDGQLNFSPDYSFQGGGSMGFRPMSGLQTSRLYGRSPSGVGSPDSSPTAAGRPVSAIRALCARPTSAMNPRRSAGAIRSPPPGVPTRGGHGGAGSAARPVSAGGAGLHQSVEWQAWRSSGAGGRPASAAPAVRSLDTGKAAWEQAAISTMDAGMPSSPTRPWSGALVVAARSGSPQHHPEGGPSSPPGPTAAYPSVFASLALALPLGAMQQGASTSVASARAGGSGPRLRPSSSPATRTYSPGIMFSSRVNQVVQR